MNNDTDNYFMGLAILEADKASALGDVPVGAVIVRDGEVVGRGYNTREADKNPLGHAEITAIKEASVTLASWRLSQCTLYVTVEPCVMCAGAILAARIERLVFGAPDKKAGAVESLYSLLDDSRLNHIVMVHSGVLGEECSEIITAFFRNLRAKKNSR